MQETHDHRHPVPNMVSRPIPLSKWLGTYYVSELNPSAVADSTRNLTFLDPIPASVGSSVRPSILVPRSCAGLGIYDKIVDLSIAIYIRHVDLRAQCTDTSGDEIAVVRPNPYP